MSHASLAVKFVLSNIIIHLKGANSLNLTYSAVIADLPQSLLRR